MKKLPIICLLLMASFTARTAQAQTAYLDTSANLKGRVSADIVPLSISFLSGSVTVSKISLSPITISGAFAYGSWSAYYFTGGVWQPIVTQQYSVNVDYTKTLLVDMSLLFGYAASMTLDNGLKLNITYK